MVCESHFFYSLYQINLLSYVNPNVHIFFSSSYAKDNVRYYLRFVSVVFVMVRKLLHFNLIL